MISLSRERGLLWLRHESLQSLALRFGTNSFLLLDPLYLLMSQVPLFVLSRLLSSLWVYRTGSASDWCALQEALYKRIDTIQYNSAEKASASQGTQGFVYDWKSNAVTTDCNCRPTLSLLLVLHLAPKRNEKFGYCGLYLV